MKLFQSLVKKGVKKLSRDIIYYNGLVVLEVIKKIPLQYFREISEVLGSFFYMSFKYERKLAESQLVKYLKIDNKSAQRVTKEMFKHFVLSFLELQNLRYFIETEGLVEIRNEEILKEEYEKGKGIILVSGHYGNWELLVSSLSSMGYPITVIMRKIYDERLNKIMINIRKEWGIESVLRGEQSSLGIMKNVLKNGRILGMLVDQDTNVPSIFVPFFGKPAYTPKAPAQFSYRFDIPIVFSYIRRVGDNRHRIVLERIEYEKTGDEERDIYEITKIINEKLERIISEYPEQWVWHHRRWKTRPE